ncbi:hypothetical protein E5329_25045 [Petralouisia muris]|jgi:hypothetical protein|uniref:Uncharacterized protein n=1 Tax=Petralouisia muris TaxID=3032872 RepID=A0AC61RNQ4_9FIRM|nr:hypothetical protein [Petralouisia muris]TGY89436.1 hypothetical protein E5329_25045 [Petralouisia muris]
MLADKRVVIRAKSSLSFAGEIKKYTNDSKGILLKPSERSEIKIWFPMDEIECIIYPNGEVKKGEELVW